MFSFFGSKKERIPDVTIFSTKVQLYKWMISEAMKSEVVIVYFFEATRKEIDLLLKAAGPSSIQLLDARAVNSSLALPSRAFVAELHPLASPYAKLVSTLREKKVEDLVLLSHLESPFFINLGGDRIKKLMNSMGLSEDESISHTMATKAIENAQQKLEKKVVSEKTTDSMESWFEANI